MIGLKKIIDYLDITILNNELFTASREWNYRNVSNPYSRIYYIMDGYGTIRHHGQTYEPVPGQMYLIPCYTTVDMPALNDLHIIMCISPRVCRRAWTFFLFLTAIIRPPGRGR